MPGSYLLYGANVKDDPSEAAPNHSSRAAHTDSAALLVELAVRRMSRG